MYNQGPVSMSAVLSPSSHDRLDEKKRQRGADLPALGQLTRLQGARKLPFW